MYIIHFRRKRNFYPFKRSDFSSSSSPSSSHAPFRKRNDSRIVIALYLDKFRYRANSHPPWIAYVEKIKINQGTVFDILRGRGGGGARYVDVCVTKSIRWGFRHRDRWPFPTLLRIIFYWSPIDQPSVLFSAKSANRSAFKAVYSVYPPPPPSCSSQNGTFCKYRSIR